MINKVNYHRAASARKILLNFIIFNDYDKIKFSYELNKQMNIYYHY